MTPHTVERPPVRAGVREISRAADRPQDTPRATRPPVPYDAQAERWVLAAAIAGPDLGPDDLDPADHYVPTHARLAEALLLLARDRRPVRRTTWRSEFGRRTLGFELPGLDRALVAVGSPDVEHDLVVAAEIMLDDPGGAYRVGGRLAGGPAWALGRVADLARRRRRLVELDAEREALLEEVTS